MMNVARKIYLMDTPYENRWNKLSERPSGAEIIPLIKKIVRQNRHADEMTSEYLNEKLAYFYNNGGPVMDL